MTITKLASVISLLLLAIACTPRPKPVAPAPPPIRPEVAKPRHVTPGPNDRAVHGCTVTKQTTNFVDCICRGASTKIDSVTGEQSLECKPIQEVKRAKH